MTSQADLKLIVFLFSLSVMFSCSLSDRNQAVPTAASILTVQFTTEEGKPLVDASATLIESKGDEFIRAHFRDNRVKIDGTISLPSSFLNLPNGSHLFVYTPDNFYWHTFDVADINKIHPSNGKITLSVPKTGIIAFTIIEYENGIEEPLVVLVSKLYKKGVYEEFSGIGIGFANNYHSVAGLPEGTYRIEVKKTYEDSKFYYRKDGIKVIAGEKSDLSGIKLIK